MGMLSSQSTKYVTLKGTASINNINNNTTHLTAIFQHNQGRPVAECLHSGRKDDDSGDNWSYKTCKFPVKSSPPSHTQLFTGWMPFLSPNQHSSTTGKHCLNQSTWYHVIQLCHTRTHSPKCTKPCNLQYRNRVNKPREWSKVGRPRAAGSLPSYQQGRAELSSLFCLNSPPLGRRRLQTSTTLKLLGNNNSTMSKLSQHVHTWPFFQVNLG